MLFLSFLMASVHPFVDENGRNFNLNSTGYLDFLREEIMPTTFRSPATQKMYWWLQDGAHSTRKLQVGA